MEYISPMVDVIFKKMFTMNENKDMLRGLVKTFLEVDIGEDFVIAGSELPPENPDEKFSRIDLHASSDIGEIDIEVQVESDISFKQRFLHYAMQLYTSSVKRGDDEYRPKPLYSLGIVNFSVFPNVSEWLTSYKILEMSLNYPYTDNFLLRLVELPKTGNLRELELDNKDQQAWVSYFRSRNEEDFTMLNEKTTNREVKKAIDVLSNFSHDPQMQEMARRRENNLIMRQSMLSGAKEEGRAEGRAEGREEGREEERMKIKSRMKAAGMTDEEINKILNA